MQSVTIKDLDKKFNDLLKAIPEARRAMFRELSEELLGDVNRRIGGRGKVQSWQDRFLGSGGGWAAVRPKAKTWTEATRSGKRYAVGYVTNAITSGHRAGARGYVPGKGFYAGARQNARAIVRRAIERFEAHLREEAEL